MVSSSSSIFLRPYIRRSCPLTQFLSLLMHQLHTSNPTDAASLAKDLAFSASTGSQALGTQLHGRALKLGFSNETFAQNNLITMYSKCGVLGDGLKVFDGMTERNLVSWTLIISAAVQIGECGLALEVYVDMMRTGLVPNEFALVGVLKGCAIAGADSFGLGVHGLALKVGLENNLFVGASLLHMYSNFGAVELAQRVFDDISTHDVGCWNAIIGGYARCGLGLKATQLVSSMHCNGTVMDQFTFINALKACAITGDVGLGRQIHGFIVKSKVNRMSKPVMNALMDMYFKNHERGLAFKIFNSMQERDVVSWNTVFVGLSQGADVKEVLNLFKRFMFTSCAPSYLTFAILFRLCGEIFELVLGLQLLSLSFCFGFYGEARVASSLIYMFSKCQQVQMARLVFDSIPFKTTNNWNELLSGYNLNCSTESLELFFQIWNSGIEVDECTLSCALEAWWKTTDSRIGRQIHGVAAKLGFASHGYVYSSLIKGYIKFRLLDEASKIYHELEALDIISWSTTIAAFAKQGCISEAINFLNRLKASEREPDEFILGSVVSCCAEVASYHLTRSVHSLIIKTGYELNTFLASAVIDAYAKSGDIRGATRAFDCSCKSDDVVLHNTMIMAYAHHGLISEATEVFDRMRSANLKPSPATFVSIVLACSHFGLVDQGRVLFRSMTTDYAIEPLPDNYSSLVDLLSRNGLLREAKNVVEAMPFKPWPGLWRCLLNGCMIHGDKELGKWAAKELLQLDPKNDAAYVVLSKFYMEDGDWDNAFKVRMEMMDQGLGEKNAGVSFVEL